MIGEVCIPVVGDLASFKCHGEDLYVRKCMYKSLNMALRDTAVVVLPLHKQFSTMQTVYLKLCSVHKH